MVWGWSWSMKIEERSSAIALPAHHVAKFLEDEAAELVPGETTVTRRNRGCGCGCAGRRRGGRPAGSGGPWLKAGEVTERLGRIRRVGNLRPLHEIARLQVLGQRGAAKESGADRHGRREVRVEAGRPRASGRVDAHAEHGQCRSVGEDGLGVVRVNDRRMAR